jgi:hypothetical protein
LGFKDWNPLKVVALGVLLMCIGGGGMAILHLNLGFILFFGLGVYATLLGVHYFFERRKVH